MVAPNTCGRVKAPPSLPEGEEWIMDKKTENIKYNRIE